MVKRLELIRDDNVDGSFGPDRGYPLDVDDDLAELLALAPSWQGHGASPALPLNFDSTFAALVGSHASESVWFREHLALRGVDREHIRERTMLQPRSLDQVKTTASFRQAIATATEIAAATTPGAPIAVRHLMAAFPLGIDWHIVDFLRLRVDRRAWCLELSRYLARRYPGEAAAWETYSTRAIPVPDFGYRADTPDGADLLSLGREVEALSRLAVARTTSTPLSIGVFGAWGAGKSFFMRSMRDRVAELAEVARARPTDLEHHGHVIQIELNAWHYSEGNLAAAFVDHIFRNLRQMPDEEDSLVEARTQELLAELAKATKVAGEREAAVAQAVAARDQAGKAVAELDGQMAAAIAAKEAEIGQAELRVAAAVRALQEQLDELEAEVEERRKEAPIRAITRELVGKLDLQPFTDAKAAVEATVTRAGALRSKTKVLAYGGAAVAIGLVGTAIAKQEAWLHAGAAATALATALGSLAPWWNKLDQVADRGQQLVEAEAKIRDDIEKHVRASYTQITADAEARVGEARAARAKLADELAALRAKPTEIRATLARLEVQRLEAVGRHAEAERRVAESQAALARVGYGEVLDAFLSERIEDDTYRKELTLFSRIRTDFERLSRLMTKADRAFVEGQGRGKPPVVGRVVLYIDDLDRCLPQRVIDVLQLVHLMLAFPLFVCVVAVDPRVITSALAQLPALKHVSADPTLQLGGPPTPRDYVEKIFQIPVWLRPVAADRIAAVTAAFFAVPLQPVEHDYLTTLSALLDGTPRRLKRFANTYLLLMSSLTDSELAVFRKTIRTFDDSREPRHYTPFKLCMALLAVLWHPGKAAELSSLIAAAGADQTIGAVLSEFGGNHGLAIASAFDDGGRASKVTTLALWFERVRRYSFFS